MTIESANRGVVPVASDHRRRRLERARDGLSATSLPSQGTLAYAYCRRHNHNAPTRLSGRPSDAQLHCYYAPTYYLSVCQWCVVCRRPTTYIILL